MYRSFLAFVFSIVTICGALVAKEPAASLIGKWRGEFEIRPGVKVPFNFEIAKKKDKKTVIYFLNADEKFEGGVLSEAGDSVFVRMDQFDNELAIKVNGSQLTGVLRKQGGVSSIATPLTATKGISYRFAGKPAASSGIVSGTYAITFKPANGPEEFAVGLFEQDGSKLKGTFLRVTGDSRYLEGVVDGNNFQLSTFIGSSPGYYKGTINDDGTISGESVGARSSTAFSGKPDEDAKLPDAYKLTFLKNGYSSLDFSFPDVDGKLVSLKDEKFRNKVVVVTIGGTWCPNCMDETNFLVPWYNRNKSRGVEVISIQYERDTDPAFVKKVLTRYRERFSVPYQQVFGGKADKQAVAASLPALNTFLSFPTSIIIDKEGKVVKIHTGFSGPATGKYYTDFVKEFEEDVDSLLKK